MDAVRFGRVELIDDRHFDRDYDEMVRAAMRASNCSRRDVFVWHDGMRPHERFIFSNDGQSQDMDTAWCIQMQELVKLREKIQEIIDSRLPFKVNRAAQAYQRFALNRCIRLFGFAVERGAISAEDAEVMLARAVCSINTQGIKAKSHGQMLLENTRAFVL